MSRDAGSGAIISRRGLRLAGLAVAVLIAAAVFFGLTTRKMAEARLNEWTEQQATPTVAVVRPDTTGRRDSIDLPGRLEAHAQAQLFARVSGYLKAWNADIGAAVKAGQLLAEIDAPDLDQQIMQGVANLASAQANAELAAATLQRGAVLMPTGAISKQVYDQRVADASNKRGLVNSAQADLDRLRVLENYKRITAPFDGLVTSRTTDVGALINAGANGGQALFVVSDVNKLRLYVNVPQTFVPSVRVGTKAQVTVPEFPGRTFFATVESSARSVDPASGTTRMQLVIDNSKGELMTGSYASVHLELVHASVAMNIPASTLMFDKSGLRVATVGLDNRVVLKPVTISRDLGKVVEIGTGLTPEDKVIEVPPDGLAQGDVVRVITPQPNKITATEKSETKPIR